MSAYEPAPEPMYQQPPPPPPPPKKSNAVKIVAIVIGVMFVLFALLIGGCFLLVNESTKDAQKVSDDFVAAVQAGDGAKAYSLTGKTFQAASTEEDLDALVKQISGLVSKDKVSPSGKSINASTNAGNVAVFTYTLKGTNGGSVYFKTQVHDDDGGWKVLSFQSAEKPLNTDVE